MKVTEILKNLKDEPFIALEHSCPKCKFTWGNKEDVTFKEAALNALLNAEVKPKDKVRRYKLCQKIEQAKGDLQLATKEAALLVDCIEMQSPILIVGRMMEILEPDAN